MITFCLSALTLLLVERHLTRDGRSIWLLVPLFLLWSNLHSGFIIGLGFMAIVLLAEVAGRALRMCEPAPPSRVRTLLYVLLACAAVAMINPNGPGILLYAFATQASSAQQTLIQEWHSPDFHQWVLIPFAVMLLSLASLVAVNRRVRARDAALLITGTALALQSVRHVALFVVLATPILAEQLTLFVRTRRGRSAPRTRRLPPLGFRVATLAVLTTLLLGAFVGGRLLPAMLTTPSAPAYAEEFPVCAAHWLAQAPEPLRIFNQYGEGGYLAYTLSAHGDRVFIFGDAALMGDQLLTTYAHVEGVQPDWDTIVRSAGTDVVLFDRNTPLANVLAAASARWTRVYADPVSIVYAPADKVSALRLPGAPSYRVNDPCAHLTPNDGSGG
jgi:hypothetical protein